MSYFYFATLCLFVTMPVCLCVSYLQALLQELEEERVRRWKAEQAAVKLADRIKTLQSQGRM